MIPTYQKWAARTPALVKSRAQSLSKLHVSLFASGQGQLGPELTAEDAEERLIGQIEAHGEA